MQYANEFIINMVLGNTTTYVYQIIFDGNDSNVTKITPYLLCVDWNHASS